MEQFIDGQSQKGLNSIIFWRYENGGLVQHTGYGPWASISHINSQDKLILPKEGILGRVLQSQTQEWCCNVQSAFLNAFDIFKYRDAVRYGIKADIAVAVPGGIIEVAGTEALPESQNIVKQIKIMFRDSLNESQVTDNVTDMNAKLQEILEKQADEGFISAIYWSKIMSKERLVKQHTGQGPWAAVSKDSEVVKQGILERVANSGNFEWCKNVQSGSQLFNHNRHSEAYKLGIKTDVVVAVKDGVLEFVSTKELSAMPKMLVDIQKLFRANEM